MLNVVRTALQFDVRCSTFGVRRWLRLIAAWCFLGGWGLVIGASGSEVPTSGYGPPTSVPVTQSITPRVSLPARNRIDQTQPEANAKSVGCLECHHGVEPMHKAEQNVVLGCTDCHGGNPARHLKLEQAHVQPRYKQFWKTSANPPNSHAWINHESPEFIRFMNPGDLRVAKETCGLCHGEIVHNVDHSMMNHGAMLWGAALYNNGAYPEKNYRFGQAYGADGAPLRLINYTPVTPEDTQRNGILPFIDPLPRFNLSNPGNILRIFEKGGRPQLTLGLPTTSEPPGKPERRLSERGLGTLNRTDPVFLGLQKTRLHDPLLGFLGSNDHPGDYRSSGCTACHVVYANDRSPTNSGWWSKYGHQGLSFTGDPTIPKAERGHPVMHQLTRAIPSSQCMNCHMHQGNLFVNPYLGYTWWDQETDGELMYPKEQHDPTNAELVASTIDNPEAAAARGLWGDKDFLDRVAELNPQMKHTQFADYHGHGWVFRAIFKHDRKGNLLDLGDNIIGDRDPRKFAKAVHLKDVHLANGMQCADCHFNVDVHGNGMLYGEPRNATTILCVDCHGTIDSRPSLVTSGNAGQIDLLHNSNTPWGPRFTWEGNRLWQLSTMSPDVRWEVPQTIDTIDPLSPHYNPKSAYAKTLRRDGTTWGPGLIGATPTRAAEPGRTQPQQRVAGVNSPSRTGTSDDNKPAPLGVNVPYTGVSTSILAHDNARMDCQICHTSWATSCFGCHLPMKANQRITLNKFEGVTDRNYTTYNPQVVRDDVFMLGIDGTVKKNRMAVIRSSSAVVVSSQNANREWVYSQQQTFSAEGYSGQAFNPHFPHTTSSVGTTKNCTDCHLSKANDNNAWMSSLLGFGTGTVNFFGRYAYVGEGHHGFHGVVWTEPDEPQAVIGSHFHSIAYPANYQKHLEHNGELQEAYEHSGHDIQDIWLRGEYLYTANGPGGFEVFDVANIDQKGFSERMVSAPFSPLGQRTRIHTKYATSIALPSTLALDPLRERLPENEEQPIDIFYGFVYVSDREEGLVNVLVGTLVDGNPDNNFFKESDTVRFNPGGALTGANFVAAAGHRLYLTTPRGLFVIDVHDPTHPRIVSELTNGFLRNPRCVAVQFRYAFVTDDDGMKVLDITDPDRPVPVRGATVPLRETKRLYVARTYAYVANGAEGLAIIDIENPERPRLDQMFNANGVMNDTHAVQIGSVSASEYALVADGRNGLRVLQLISPDTVPGAQGFSPRPNPRLIATYPTKGEAICVSRGLERDRVVDETGGQTVVFGRRGSRPFHLDEMARFYKREVDAKDYVTERRGDGVYRVEDITMSGGVLMTKSGTVLTPIPTPTPSPTASPSSR